MKKTIKKEFLFMAIGLFLVMVIGITVIIGEVTKIEQAEQLVTDGYISMEKYYGRVEKKIETCQKYANILTALSDEDMLIAGDISGNMETEEEAIAQYLTEMEKLTKDISEQSLTDSFMTYSSVNKELMEQLKECRQARDDGDIAKAKSIIGGSALEKIQARESASVMSDSTGIPQVWHRSILARERPSSTCVTAISASFTFTSTFRPSALVATPC